MVAVTNPPREGVLCVPSNDFHLGITVITVPTVRQ